MAIGVVVRRGGATEKTAAAIHDAIVNGATEAFVWGQSAVSTAVKSLADDFGFSADELSRAKRAYVTATKAAVRYMYDGSDPTDEVGHLLPQDATPPLEVIGNGNLNNMRMVLDAAAAIAAVVIITLEE